MVLLDVPLRGGKHSEPFDVAATLHVASLFLGCAWLRRGGHDGLGHGCCERIGQGTSHGWARQ